MKKVLLLIVSFFIFIPAAWSYQTVLVNFPQDQGWHSAYYSTQGDETILQYTPGRQNARNWSRALIFHSYKNSPYDTSKMFMDKLIAQMEFTNGTRGYRYLKNDENDGIATRCVTKNANTPTQCEIFRVTNSFEGYITMHYINKNVANFKNTYSEWVQIMRTIRIYYSYYMDDRILNKATVFQL